MSAELRRGDAKMRVLLVEDDELIGKAIVAGLSKHGITVHHVGTACEAEAAQQEDTFHALVLDLGLPDRDGMELLASARAFEPGLPVLILSARDAIEHRLMGLQSGADDYMVKPFDLRELAARLHALIRRTQGRAAQTITAGPLWLDADTRCLSADLLSERRYGLGEEVSSNALNVHIHNIRRKLGSQSIETARGLGYRLGWRLTP